MLSSVEAIADNHVWRLDRVITLKVISVENDQYVMVNRSGEILSEKILKVPCDDCTGRAQPL